MAAEMTAAQQEQARAAVVAAVAAVRDMRNIASDLLPASSRGRSRIIASCDEALSTVATAVTGASLGDEPSMWQRAVDAGLRAVEVTRAFIEEVARTAVERLAQLWRITRDAAETVKRKVAEVLGAAWRKARDAVETAKRFLLIGVAAVSGTFVILSGLFLLWLFSPSSKSKET